MSQAMSVVLRGKPGTADTFRKVLSEISGPTRDEPGCVVFEAHAVPDEADTFFIYEQYADEGAVKAHLASDMFKRVENELFPLVEEREFKMYDKLD